MSDQCRECGSTDLENDEQQGQVVCTGCGAVIKDYILLAQQQFQETAGGITAVGQHVGEGCKCFQTAYFLPIGCMVIYFHWF